MARLYTRAGDAGTTGVLGGPRIPKDHARIRAVGDVDEANAAIGLALAFQTDPRVIAILRNAQNTLFTVGAEVGSRPKAKGPRVTRDHVATLETAMEVLDVGEINEFVMPRGSPAVASLHLARTVVRRAERACVALNRKEKISPEPLRYLNRLSSLLFQAAVWVQRQQKSPEEHPTYG
jgi:cob(I)alamin adenosyltransferase